MLDISTRNAKDVLIDGTLPEYEAAMKVFHHQLIHLTTTLEIADKIHKFPFNLFITPDKAVFFEVVQRNFFDAGLLIITRLLTDDQSNAYTLKRFKGKMQKLVKPEFIKEFNKRLKKHEFDKSIKDLSARARIVRNERIAHLDEDVALGVSEGAHLNFSELKALHDALIFLFDALSFNDDYIMLRGDYDHTGDKATGERHKLYIDELLDFVAMKSTLLSLPEKDPIGWSYRRTSLTDAQVSIISYYRRKLGLNEVS